VTQPQPPPYVDPAVLGVIAFGGGCGSVLRWVVSHAWRGSAFPAATLLINLVGSLLLGALAVAVTEIWRPHRLLRPALGTGVLGGFTTFSTFALESTNRAAGVGSAYVAASLAGGVLCAALGMAAVRRLEPRFRLADEHEALDPFDPDLP